LPPPSPIVDKQFSQTFKTEALTLALAASLFLGLGLNREQPPFLYTAAAFQSQPIGPSKKWGRRRWVIDHDERARLIEKIRQTHDLLQNGEGEIEPIEIGQTLYLLVDRQGRLYPSFPRGDGTGRIGQPQSIGLKNNLISARLFMGRRADKTVYYQYHCIQEDGDPSQPHVTDFIWNEAEKAYQGSQDNLIHKINQILSAWKNTPGEKKPVDVGQVLGPAVKHPLLNRDGELEGAFPRGDGAGNIGHKKPIGTGRNLSSAHLSMGRLADGTLYFILKYKRAADVSPDFTSFFWDPEEAAYLTQQQMLIKKITKAQTTLSAPDAQPHVIEIGNVLGELVDYQGKLKYPFPREDGGGSLNRYQRIGMGEVDLSSALLFMERRADGKTYYLLRYKDKKKRSPQLAEFVWNAQKATYIGQRKPFIKQRDLIQTIKQTQDYLKKAAGEIPPVKIGFLAGPWVDFPLVSKRGELQVIYPNGDGTGHLGHLKPIGAGTDLLTGEVSMGRRADGTIYNLLDYTQGTDPTVHSAEFVWDAEEATYLSRQEVLLQRIFKARAAFAASDPPSERVGIGDVLDTLMDRQGVLHSAFPRGDSDVSLGAPAHIGIQRKSLTSAYLSMEQRGDGRIYYILDYTETGNDGVHQVEFVWNSEQEAYRMYYRTPAPQDILIQKINQARRTLTNLDGEFQRIEIGQVLNYLVDKSGKLRGPFPREDGKGPIHHVRDIGAGANLTSAHLAMEWRSDQIFYVLTYTQEDNPEPQTAEFVWDPQRRVFIGYSKNPSPQEALIRKIHQARITLLTTPEVRIIEIGEIFNLLMTEMGILKHIFPRGDGKGRIGERGVISAGTSLVSARLFMERRDDGEIYYVLRYMQDRFDARGRTFTTPLAVGLTVFKWNVFHYETVERIEPVPLDYLRSIPAWSEWAEQEEDYVREAMPFMRGLTAFLVHRLDGIHASALPAIAYRLAEDYRSGARRRLPSGTEDEDDDKDAEDPQRPPEDRDDQPDRNDENKPATPGYEPLLPPSAAQSDRSLDMGALKRQLFGLLKTLTAEERKVVAEMMRTGKRSKDAGRVIDLLQNALKNYASNGEGRSPDPWNQEAPPAKLLRGQSAVVPLTLSTDWVEHPIRSAFFAGISLLLWYGNGSLLNGSRKLGRLFISALRSLRTRSPSMQARRLLRLAA
jgi:hypothetical protein